jgi:hypothetical protein
MTHKTSFKPAYIGRNWLILRNKKIDNNLYTILDSNILWHCDWFSGDLVLCSIGSPWIQQHKLGFCCYGDDEYKNSTSKAPILETNYKGRECVICHWQTWVLSVANLCLDDRRTRTWTWRCMLPRDIEVQQLLHLCHGVSGQQLPPCGICVHLLHIQYWAINLKLPVLLKKQVYPETLEIWSCTFPNSKASPGIHSPDKKNEYSNTPKAQNHPSLCSIDMSKNIMKGTLTLQMNYPWWTFKRQTKYLKESIKIHSLLERFCFGVQIAKRQPSLGMVIFTEFQQNLMKSRQICLLILEGIIPHWHERWCHKEHMLLKQGEIPCHLIKGMYAPNNIFHFAPRSAPSSGTLIRVCSSAHKVTLPPLIICSWPLWLTSLMWAWHSFLD